MQLTNEKNQKILKWIIAILLIGFVIYLIVDSFTSKRLGDALNSFLNWMEDNLVLGSFAFAGVYIMCTVLFVPGSALTLGAGFIYGSAMSSSGAGVALGSTVVFFSASVGACVAFFVGRFVMRDCSQRLFDRFKVMHAIDKALETKGTKLMLLLRLSPRAFQRLELRAGCEFSKVQRVCDRLFGYDSRNNSICVHRNDHFGDW